MTRKAHSTTSEFPPLDEGWEWRALSSDAIEWRVLMPDEEGAACRWTTGPGHATCRGPAVATLKRGRARREWGYCELHLYGRIIVDGVVYARCRRVT